MTTRTEDPITCLECAAFISEISRVEGICQNEDSDHFAHIIAFKHPACDRIRLMGVRENEASNG